MAWIEVHQTLPTHRKTIEAAAILDITPVQVVGHLVCLWLWALDNAPEGVMYTSRNALRNKMVANVSQWGGDPDLFVEALTEAGFLNELDDALELHDWYDYAGKLMETRKANRERQRRYRESKKQQEANVERNANVTRDVTVTKSERHAPTVPNRTVPNSTIDSKDNVAKKFDDDSIPMRLALHLKREILSQDPNTRVPDDLTNWATEADRMMRLDNRDPQEAANLMTWAQHDPFWRANILSMSKFRKQYDTLKRQAMTPKRVTGQNGETAAERLLREEIERERAEADIIDIAWSEGG
jgi:hypothetical protein